MKELIKFLKARRKTLHHIKDQIKFDKIIPDKKQAELIVRGRLNEIERIIRKINSVGLDKMTKKEITSLNIILNKKRNQLINLGKIPECIKEKNSEQGGEDDKTK